MRGPHSQRGAALTLVLAVLVVLGIVMGVMVQILVTDLLGTKRRANAQYAIQLAHSGIDWARATVEARRALQNQTLKVQGGEIVVEAERTEGGYRVTSRGRVLQDGKAVEIREEVLDIGIKVEHVDDPPGAPVVDPLAGPPGIGVPIPFARPYATPRPMPRSPFLPRR